MTTAEKMEFQEDFLSRLGPCGMVFKQLMDTLPHVGFYIKDSNDRIVALNCRNGELSGLKDEFEAVGKKSSDLFPEMIARDCLQRDALVRQTEKPTIGGINQNTVDRSPWPTIYSVFPLHDAKGALIGTCCVFYDSNQQASSRSRYAKLNPVLDHISRHFTDNLSIDDLAQSASMSVTHFRRVFRTLLGITPVKYISRLRLNEARKRLENTDDTITDIAVSTGFWDQSHFVKIFKQTFGETPNVYRKRHRSTFATSSGMKDGVA